MKYDGFLMERSTEIFVRDTLGYLELLKKANVPLFKNALKNTPRTPQKEEDTEEDTEGDTEGEGKLSLP